MPVILAKSSRRKSRYRTGSLTLCEMVPKRGLLVLNLQKPTAAKELQTRRLSAFALKTITLRNFEKKIYTHEANASVKRNTANTIKQQISLKLAMKMQDEAARVAYCSYTMCDTKALKITRKSTLTLYDSELAWVE